MKGNLINRAEEKFVFGISRAVWRTIVFLSAIGAFLGLLLLLWALIPPFKKNIKKEAYPPIVQVQAEEILARLNRPPESEASQKPAPSPREREPEYQPQDSQANSVSQVRYRNAVDSLRLLFPDSLYSWDNKYQTVTRRNWWSSYEERVLVKRGLGDLLKNAMNSVEATDFDSAAILVDSYIQVISLFPVDKREQPFETITQFTTKSVAFTVENNKALAAAAPHFKRENSDFVRWLAIFAANNPQDGLRFIQFVTQTVDSFSIEVREEILARLYTAYYFPFRQSLDEQINVTSAFIAMRTQFTQDQQAKALEEYYSLYKEKNSDRKRVIDQIERDYQLAQAESEAKYLADKADKAEKRTNGLRGLGAGIGLIAVIAILLALLSIQRTVRNIEQKMSSK